MKYLNIVTICCLIAFYGCTVKKETATSKTTDSSGQLKILCYNIHHANPPSKVGFIDIDAIARVINDSKADVVTLQEVDKNTVRSGKMDQAKVIAEKTGMNYHFFKAIDHDGGDYGLAILSRFPLKDIKSFPLPQKVLAEKRILAQVTIKIVKQDVIFANTHMDATRGHENRTAQMQFITDLYKNTTAPIIISGDFNSKDGSEAIKLLDQQFKRTCITNCPPTVPQINPRSTIDYIATKNIDWPMLKHEVIEEIYASDHRPISAIFKIK